MSGAPYPEGIKELVLLVQDMQSLQGEIVQSRLQLDKYTQHLTKAEEAYRQAARQIKEKLAQMDLLARGNHGWEGRFEWFLLEFYRQTKEEVG